MNTRMKWMLGILLQIMDTVICAIGHCLTVGIIFTQTVSITTIIYRTEHRLFWAVYIDSILYICIACAVSAFLLLIFTEFAIFPKQILKKLKKRDKIYNAEIVILCVLCFVALAVADVMLKWKWQTFTGDPWWYAVRRSLIAPVALFGFCRAFQMTAYNMIESSFDKNGI